MWWGHLGNAALPVSVIAQRTVLGGYQLPHGCQLTSKLKSLQKSLTLNQSLRTVHIAFRSFICICKQVK